MRKIVVAASVLGLISLAGCSGIRQSSGTFVAHAESFRIFGLAIPGDDQQAAYNLVPRGATVTNVSSSAADWTSLVGFFGNLFGFHGTQIGGTTAQ